MDNQELTPQEKLEAAEVLRAQENLQKAKTAVIEANKLKVAKAQEAIEAARVEKEKQLFAQRLRAEEIQAHWAKKKQEEEAALVAQHIRERAEQIQRENLLNEAVEASRKQERHAERLKRIEQEAFLAEREAERIRNEALAAERTVAPPEEVDLASTYCEPQYFPPPEVIHPVERPPCTPESIEATAQMWYHTSGVKLTPLQASTVSQLYTAEAIKEALGVVMAHSEFQTRFKFRDAQFSACLYVCGAGPEALGKYIANLDGEKLAKEEAIEEQRLVEFQVRHGN